MRRNLGILTVVLAAFLTACGGSATPKALAPTEPAVPSSQPSGSPGGSSLSPDAAVAAVSLRRSDLPSGYSGNVMRGGDQVDGQVTLDMCGYHFVSESMRVARRQTAFRLGKQANSISSEVVAYQPGGADTAMKEIAAAIASCPRGYVGSAVAGQPATKQVITRIPTRPGWQPGTIAFRMSVSAQTGQHFTMTAIYQRHGDLLGAIYAFGTAVKDLDHAAGLVSTRLSRAGYDGSAA